MNCTTAKAAIDKSATDNNQVLTPETLEHIDNCDDCNLALLNSIAEGLDSGRLETFPMPNRLRLELGLGDEAESTPLMRTLLSRWLRLTPVRFTLQTAASAFVIALLLIVLRPRLFSANSNSSDILKQQLATANREVETEKAKLKFTEDKNNELARQQQLAQATSEEEKKSLNTLTAQVDRLNKKINSSAVPRVTEVGKGVYRDPGVGLVFTKPVPHEDEKTVIAAVTTGDIPIPSRIGDLNERTARMGDNGSTPTTITLLNPVGTFVVSNRPAFRWKQLNRGRYYRLALMSVVPREVVAKVFLNSLPNGEWDVHEYSRDPSQPPAGYKSKSGTEWNSALSASFAPLQPGRSYYWRVDELGKPGEDAPVIGKPPYMAEFQVANAVEAAQFSQGPSLYGGSHLLLGAYYASHGFIEDARKELNLEPDKKAAAQVLMHLPKAP